MLDRSAGNLVSLAADRLQGLPPAQRGIAFDGARKRCMVHMVLSAGVEHVMNIRTHGVKSPVQKSCV
jgi:hypothetical protein